ncbi:hypothetical protein M23134_04846 [Microscilla marina ATCC 23134]|uniref:Uncharacterized protein n=1 Tax=Microscilla marina ATCC 23134 TaxID=313606 RepID=A1ZS08_MICM2|nr:hypothetical protein M23134_04846 [Microscilla marina ATCC 23134]
MIACFSLLIFKFLQKPSYISKSIKPHPTKQIFHCVQNDRLQLTEKNNQFSDF